MTVALVTGGMSEIFAPPMLVPLIKKSLSFRVGPLLRPMPVVTGVAVKLFWDWSSATTGVACSQSTFMSRYSVLFPG